MRTFAIFAALFAAIATAPVASAQGHVQGAHASFSGNTIFVSGRVVGLGNQSTLSIKANVDATCVDGTTFNTGITDTYTVFAAKGSFDFTLKSDIATLFCDSSGISRVTLLTVTAE